MDIRATILREGDVIHANKSLCITGLSADHGTLTVGQSFKNVAQPTAEIRHPEPVYVVDVEGPAAGNVQYGSNGPTLSEILTKEGINIHGKNFLVVRTNMEGGGLDGYNSSYPDGHHVTAQELTAGNELNPKGLKIKFYQTGCFIQDCMVQKPEVVGRMEPTFGAFKAG